MASRLKIIHLDAEADVSMRRHRRFDKRPADRQTDGRTDVGLTTE